MASDKNSDNNKENLPGVWPPPLERHPPPHGTEQPSFFAQIGRDQRLAVFIGLLTNVIMPAGLLFVALGLQWKYGKSYDLMGRQVPDRDQVRFVAFCIWGFVVALNLAIARFLRRYSLFMQRFLICTALASLFTLYGIWAWVYPYKIQ